jgi:hypothetical protein
MDADDLYGLALEEFVGARNALAKELRKADNREEAAAVAALRRPSIAAWSVNQLVRTQSRAVEELFDAGDALRDAQSDLLGGGGDARVLRTAADRERAAVDALVERARGLLSSTGDELSTTIVDRVAETLHAAALDEDARDQVRHGRLERELRHVGLGLGLGAGDATPPRPGARTAEQPPSGAAKAKRKRDTSESPSAAAESKRASKPQRETPDADPAAPEDQAASAPATPSAAGKRAERERAAAQREEAERVRRERAAVRREARAGHVAARRRADAATRALHAAEASRDDALEALRDAEAAVDAAAKQAADASASLKRAETHLAAAERRP